MGERHKHADVIIAWANGAEIEVLGSDGWEDTNPIWHSASQYRIKPRLVKKEGWVNVYDCRDATIWPSKKEADRVANAMRKACIRIEWEEEGE